ncbi:MAG: glycosyl transferase [Bifidobacteriaceae bacterium]|nr:glycosyl transferase [Bifidobacteriaceae bacterium]
MSSKERRMMALSYFDDAAREYVITTARTPAAWINYLGSEEFFSLISHRGGGYSFFKDAKLRRLTRFRYNQIGGDDAGRRLYVHDSGQVWSAPASLDLDHFEARHGLGYSRYVSQKVGLEVRQLFFVPLGAAAEVEQVTLTNLSDQVKHLTVFSYREFCLWDAWDDQTNFQRNYSTGEVEVDGQVIYHITEYRERRNHYAFFSASHPLSGFDTDRDQFLGQWNSLDQAQVPAAGKASDSVASGWRPIGSHAIEITLEPGQSQELTFILGYAECAPEDKWGPDGKVNKAPAQALLSRFATTSQVQAAWQELKDYWAEALAGFQVSSDDPVLSRMVNTWNAYQCMVTFNLSRSASYFESGIGRGMGFRDSNQDLVGVAHIVPSRVRQRLLDLAGTQFADGSAYHQYQPLTRQGNHELGSGFNDDPLWLIYGAATYLRETGDWAVLDETVDFALPPGGQAVPSDGAAASQPATQPKGGPTMMDHLWASHRHVLNNLGPHGLPLIGRADWNDCLNLNCFSDQPGESFQTTANRVGRVAESVFIAGLYCAVAPDLAEIARHRGQDSQAQEILTAAAAIRQAVEQHGWDGAWFRRAYDAAGNPVGSSSNAEGQIYIEPQGICVMGGIDGPDADYSHKALESVAERLAGPDGIVLLDPPYSRYHLELGEISSYPPGYKENGAVFCHNNPWIIIAETMAGDPARALDYYRRITPAYREDPAVYRAEPYVYAQMISGPAAPRQGEAKNSWLTGTAAWVYKAVTQHLLGVRPGFDGLIVDPKVPAEFGDFQVVRHFRGATYQISVRNPGGPGRLAVDGNPLDGNTVPPAAPGSTVKVTWVGQPSAIPDSQSADTVVRDGLDP